MIAAAGTGKKEVEGEQLSEEMEEMIEKRSTVVKQEKNRPAPLQKKHVNPSEGNCAFKYSVQWRLSGCCDSGR